MGFRVSWCTGFGLKLSEKIDFVFHSLSQNKQFLSVCDSILNEMRILMFSSMMWCIVKGVKLFETLKLP